MVNRTDRVINSMKPEPKAPVMGNFFTPNHSGVVEYQSRKVINKRFIKSLFFS